jgi:hypothetical protein
MRLLSALIVVAATNSGCASDDGTAVFLERYSRTQDPRSIVVYFTTDECDTWSGPSVTESLESVRVTILVKRAKESCGIAPIPRSVTVLLREELGGRAVIGRPQDPPLPEVPPTPAA